MPEPAWRGTRANSVHLWPTIWVASLVCCWMWPLHQATQNIRKNAKRRLNGVTELTFWSLKDPKTQNSVFNGTFTLDSAVAKYRNLRDQLNSVSWRHAQNSLACPPILKLLETMLSHNNDVRLFLNRDLWKSELTCDWNCWQLCSWTIMIFGHFKCRS